MTTTELIALRSKISFDAEMAMFETFRELSDTEYERLLANIEHNHGYVSRPAIDHEVELDPGMDDWALPPFKD